MQQRPQQHLGRRGGRHQQRERERDRSRSPTVPCTSALAEKLLLSWAWKQASAKEIQEIASSAEQDYGRSNPILRKVAKIGSEGLNPQNAQRDLVRSFMKTPTEQYLRKLSGSTVDTIVMPHELFHFMHKEYPSEFSLRFGAKDTWLQNFWEGFASTPQGANLMASHPYLQGRRLETYSGIRLVALCCIFVCVWCLVCSLHRYRCVSCSAACCLRWVCAADC